MAESSPTELAGQFNNGLCLTEPGVAVTAMGLNGDVGPEVPVIPAASEYGAAPTDRDALEVEPFPKHIHLRFLDFWIRPGYPWIQHQDWR